MNEYLFLVIPVFLVLLSALNLARKAKVQRIQREKQNILAEQNAAREKKRQLQRLEIESLEESGDYRKLVSKLVEAGDFRQAAYVATVMRDYPQVRSLIDKQIQHGEQPKNYLGAHFEYVARISGHKALEADATKYLANTNNIEEIDICLSALRDCMRYQLIIEIASDLSPAIASSPEVTKRVISAQNSLDFFSDRMKKVTDILNSPGSTFREKTSAAHNFILWGDRDRAEKLLNSLTPDPDDREQNTAYLQSWSFIFYMEKEFKRQEEILRQLIELEPDEFNYFLMERCLHFQGRYSEAFEYFKLGAVEGEISKYPSYEADYRAAVGDRQRALELYREAVRQELERVKQSNPDAKKISLCWELWRIFELTH